MDWFDLLAVQGTESQPSRCEISLCHLPFDVYHLHDLDERNLLLLFEPSQEGEILYDTSPPHICGNHNKQILCNLFMQNAEFKLLTEIEVSSKHLVCGPPGGTWEDL